MNLIDRAPAIISELIGASTRVGCLTNSERAEFLQLAASTIESYRAQFTLSDEQTSYEAAPGSAVHIFNEAARLIDQLNDAEVNEALLEAAETIKACQTLLDLKREFEGKPGRAGVPR